MESRLIKPDVEIVSEVRQVLQLCELRLSDKKMQEKTRKAEYIFFMFKAFSFIKIIIVYTTPLLILHKYVLGTG